MKIEGLGAPHQPDPKGKKPEDKDQIEKSKDGSKPVHDSVELSRRKIDQDKTGYSADVARKERLADRTSKDTVELRRKSADGYYDRKETRARTSEKLIDSPEMKDVVDRYHDSDASQEIRDSQVTNQDRVKDVKRKMSQGFYNNPANYGDIADKIMDHFDI